MNEMIERVARAIGVPEQSGLVCDWSLKAARAAIEAMREPTRAMVDVGDDRLDGANPTDAWQHMIDEALSGTSK